MVRKGSEERNTKLCLERESDPIPSGTILACAFHHVPLAAAVLVVTSIRVGTYFSTSNCACSRCRTVLGQSHFFTASCRELAVATPLSKYRFAAYLEIFFEHSHPDALIDRNDSLSMDKGPANE